MTDTGYMFARSAELGAAPSISVFEPKAPKFIRPAIAGRAEVDSARSDRPV